MSGDGDGPLERALGEPAGTPDPSPGAILAGQAVGYRVIRSGRIRFVTETGSRYLVEFDRGWWSRVPTLASGPLRSEEGPILALHFGGLNRRALLDCPPFVPGSPGRFIWTSWVVAWDEEPPGDEQQEKL